MGQGNALAKAQLIKFILDAGNREQRGYEGAGGLRGTKTARKQASMLQDFYCKYGECSISLNILLCGKTCFKVLL